MKISNSGIQAFKSCPRMYELRYKYGLIPVETSNAIERGLSYHAGLERLLDMIKYGEAPKDQFDGVSPKVAAMLCAFGEKAVPKLNAMGVHIAETEKWFEYQTESGHTVVGRLDGVTDKGDVVEHKSTSGLIDGIYLQRLQFDEQIPTYMLATGAEQVFYTVCSTPSLRQKRDESEDDFIVRCVEWFDEDSAHKIDVIPIWKTFIELKEFAEAQDRIITHIEKCKDFYRNPNHCMKWGRLCEYAPICFEKDLDRDFVNFKRKEI